MNSSQQKPELNARNNNVTSHEGLILQDLVGYDDEHHLTNGEGNADGTKSCAVSAARPGTAT